MCKFVQTVALLTFNNLICNQPVNQKKICNKMVDHNTSISEMIIPITTEEYIELDMFGRANVFGTEDKRAYEMKRSPKSWNAICQELRTKKMFAWMRPQKQHLGDSSSRRKQQSPGTNLQEEPTVESELVDTYVTSATCNQTGDYVETMGKGRAAVLPPVGERVLPGRGRRASKFSAKSVFRLATCCFSPSQPLENQRLQGSSFDSQLPAHVLDVLQREKIE